MEHPTWTTNPRKQKKGCKQTNPFNSTVGEEHTTTRNTLSIHPTRKISKTTLTPYWTQNQEYGRENQIRDERGACQGQDHHWNPPNQGDQWGKAKVPLRIPPHWFKDAIQRFRVPPYQFSLQHWTGRHFHLADLFLHYRRRLEVDPRVSSRCSGQGGHWFIIKLEGNQIVVATRGKDA